MFMILVLHVDFFSLGAPNHMDLETNTINALCRSFFEIICVGAVDLFVLISGWFGIRTSRKSLAKFLFQSFFIITFVNVIGVATSNVIGLRVLINESLFFSHAWFVVAYLGLFTLSPILNAFVKQSSYRVFRITIVAFFALQTFFGCIRESVGFCQGYSIISFIGLYLLGRFAKIYHNHNTKYGKWLAIGALVACNLLFILSITINSETIKNMACNYTSPLIIAAMLGVVLWVGAIKPFYSRLINFIAASAFSVYLIHMCNQWSASLYRMTAIKIYDSFSGIHYISAIVLFMVAVFMLGVIVDQIRKVAWCYLERTCLMKKIIEVQL